MNLKSSWLWAFVEESQGIPISPNDLVLPLLHLRHAIHLVFRGSDLQPLMVEELSLVEDIMSGKFCIPSAKALLKDAVSSSQKERKRKRLSLLDTGVMDDPEGYKMSKAETDVTHAGTPPAFASIEPSSAKKAQSKSSEGEGSLTVTLSVEGSAYSDPSFVKDVTDALLLPADRKRLNEIGLVQSASGAWPIAIR